MSVDSSPSSEEPRLGSAEDSSGENMPQEGQSPKPHGAEIHDLADTSSLPKATMPVSLTPNPTDPVDSPEAHVPSSEEDVPTETPQNASEGARVASPKPAGFGGWVCSLSLIEKLCCLLIVAGVLLFVLTVFLPALLDFPKEVELQVSGDFPIKGKYLEVTSANTYWRKPMLEGEGADIVRDGTILIPVLDMKLSGSGRLRVLFRDGEGALVGDPVALSPNGSQDFAATSTVGLNQEGDFAEHRTGIVELWTVEFYEAPVGATKQEDFKSLFQMKILPIKK